jgi:hypothetical protein
MRHNPSAITVFLIKLTQSRLVLFMRAKPECKNNRVVQSNFCKAKANPRAATRSGKR